MPSVPVLETAPLPPEGEPPASAAAALPAAGVAIWQE